MKIYVLSENTASAEGFACEHGLSLYIEFAGRRLLFDTGASSIFAENAAKMGVDLSKVDACILSHGHQDHGGGLAKFMEINATAPIYVQRQAFVPHFNDADKDISIEPQLQASPRIVYVDDTMELDEHMLIDCKPAAAPAYAINAYGLQMCKEGSLKPDDFLHEQYLVLEEQGKRVLFSGCSHRGILNLLQWFQPDIVVGGFHFFKLRLEEPRDRAYLQTAAKLLQQTRGELYTCHCTGMPQYAFLKESLPELKYLAAGAIIEL